MFAEMTVCTVVNSKELALDIYELRGLEILGFAIKMLSFTKSRCAANIINFCS